MASEKHLLGAIPARAIFTTRAGLLIYACLVLLAVELILCAQWLESDVGRPQALLQREGTSRVETLTGIAAHWVYELFTSINGGRLIKILKQRYAPEPLYMPPEGVPVAAGLLLIDLNWIVICPLIFATVSSVLVFDSGFWVAALGCIWVIALIIAQNLYLLSHYTTPYQTATSLYPAYLWHQPLAIHVLNRTYPKRLSNGARIELETNDKYTQIWLVGRCKSWLG
ncbi:RHTO0S10e03048g1_1 [Rhodotorula toruloides]|uniref:RHTO0S10e03048g1_1 n=1 Tax=Rhodotorula toruloides TaxID=5286 RepID=A0A061B5Y4_RHOTO|nr:RHTO0S10e03048g1_1 [Rhodotorula toruloides]